MSVSDSSSIKEGEINGILEISWNIYFSNSVLFGFVLLLLKALSLFCHILQ